MTDMRNGATTSPVIAVLGSTGSVGLQALDVAEKEGIRVDMIAARRNTALLEQQVRRFRPRLCCVTDTEAAAALQIAVADTGTRVLAGDSGLLYGIADSAADTYINAILGEAGLIPTLEVAKTGKRLALANKESLVIAGALVNAAICENHAEMIPVDSEHSAIFQCLKSGRSSEVKKILLTASGGPFYGRDRRALAAVTKNDTLRHPTWKMGEKITVDSATLMNKGFEVIEAVHLFHVAPEQIEVIVHRESIIHSAVEYIDNTVIAELSVPDMRACVQYAVSYPYRTVGVTEPLDLFRVGRLTFLPPDGESFPLLPLAYSAIRDGGAVPAVVNAANEEAVRAFLSENISFLEIADCVCETTENLRGQAKTANSLEEILSFDREARNTAVRLIERFKERK